MQINLPTPDLSQISSSQINAALRHVGTATAAATGTLVAIGALPPETAQSIVADVQQISHGLSDATAGFSNLIVLVAPLVVAWIGKIAAVSGSVKNLAGSLSAAANSSNQQMATEAKAAILTATVELPDAAIVGKIVAPPEVAAAVPSPKVVAPEAPSTAALPLSTEKQS